MLLRLFCFLLLAATMSTKVNAQSSPQCADTSIKVLSKEAATVGEAQVIAACKTRLAMEADNEQLAYEIVEWFRTIEAMEPADPLPYILPFKDSTNPATLILIGDIYSWIGEMRSDTDPDSENYIEYGARAEEYDLAIEYYSQAARLGDVTAASRAFSEIYNKYLIFLSDGDDTEWAKLAPEAYRWLLTSARIDGRKFELERLLELVGGEKGPENYIPRDELVEELILICREGRKQGCRAIAKLLSQKWGGSTAEIAYWHREAAVRGSFIDANDLGELYEKGLTRGEIESLGSELTPDKSDELRMACLRQRWLRYRLVDGSSVYDGSSFDELSAFDMYMCLAASREYPEEDDIAAAYGRTLIAEGRVDEGAQIILDRTSSESIDIIGYLGVIYEFGYGVDRDFARAADYYSRAAREGLSAAQLNLARLMRAELVEQDNKGALGWYREASLQGDKRAFIHLTELLYERDGASEEAGKWARESFQGYGGGRLERFSERVNAGQLDQACGFERDIAAKQQVVYKPILVYCALSQSAYDEAISYFELAASTRFRITNLERIRADIALSFGKLDEAQAIYVGLQEKIKSTDLRKKERSDLHYVNFGLFEIARRRGALAEQRRIFATAFDEKDEYVFHDRNELYKIFKSCGNLVRELWPIVMSGLNDKDFSKNYEALRYFPELFNIGTRLDHSSSTRQVVEKQAAEFGRCYPPENLDKLFEEDWKRAGIAPPMRVLVEPLLIAAKEASNAGFAINGRYLALLALEVGGTALTPSERASISIEAASLSLRAGRIIEAKQLLEGGVLSNAELLNAKEQTDYARILIHNRLFSQALGIYKAILAHPNEANKASYVHLAAEIGKEIALFGLGGAATGRVFDAETAPFLSGLQFDQSTSWSVKLDLLTLDAIAGNREGYLARLSGYFENAPLQAYFLRNSSLFLMEGLLASGDRKEAASIARKVYRADDVLDSGVGVRIDDNFKQPFEAFLELFGYYSSCYDITPPEWSRSDSERIVRTETNCLDGPFRFPVEEPVLRASLLAEAAQRSAIYWKGRGKAQWTDLAASQERFPIPAALQLGFDELERMEPGRLGQIRDDLSQLVQTSVIDNLAFTRAQTQNDSPVGSAEAFSQAQKSARPEIARIMVQLLFLEREIVSLERRLLLAPLQSNSSEKTGDQLSAEEIAQLLNKARSDAAATRERLEEEYPGFSDLINPKPLRIEDTQKLLKENELLLLTFSGRTDAFVWALTQKSAKIYKGELNRFQVEELVRSIRTSVKIRPKQPLPLFDRESAFKLFSGLFGQIEELDSVDREVLLVVDGALASLPPGILVMEKPTGTSDNAEDLRATKWWALNHPLTVLPAVSSLRLLRNPLATEGNGSHSNQLLKFGGFGAPALAPAKEPVQILDPAMFLRSGSADVKRVRELTSLPQTEAEIRSIASLFEPDAARLFLGEQNTETNVRNSPLDTFSLIAFATHGLLAGEIGQDEPSLVFTPPRQDTDIEPRNDGLLTASEIAGLAFRARLILLSACNTASGGSLGARPLSGLAKSFFFAGAESLLVSHWPVLDEVAPIVTARIVKEAMDAPSISWAEAHRRALKKIFESKHDLLSEPAAWAPFMIVGLNE